MPRRPPPPPRLAAAALLAGLVLVAAAATTLPEAPLRLVGPLAAHVAHLAAAFALGRAILRIPGAAPREALDVLVSSLGAGLAGLSLLTLLGTTFVACAWWMPWAIDAVALALGLLFGRLRDAFERVAEPWRRRDMAVIVASRLPLHLSLCLVTALHVVPPFLPPTATTGADALVLPAQAALRGDLGLAAAAFPTTRVTPTQGLLLHGWLTGGAPGALLFGATALALLAAAVWLHANRHLGDRAAAWSTLILLSTPLVLPATARDPGTELGLMLAFLAFHEVADWCQRATGGKIALAAIYGGVLCAESARGVAAYAAVLALLFLVQAVIDRNGVLRQIPGLLGMAAISVLVALPFVLLAGQVRPTPPEGRLRAAVAPYVPDAARARTGLPPREVPPVAPAIDTADALADDGSAADDPAELAARWARLALLLGPLMLGMLAALPLVPEPAEPLRHAALVALLSGALALLPAPYGGGGLMLVPPAALVAGGTAVALLAARGWVARTTVLLAVVALPACVALALARGPDIPLGAGHLLGRVGAAEYVAMQAPDAPLVEAVRSHDLREGRSLLLVGAQTDVLHEVPARRVPDLGRGRELAQLMTGADAVELVAVDRATARPEEMAALAGCRTLYESADARWAVLVAAPAPPPAPRPATAADAGATGLPAAQGPAPDGSGADAAVSTPDGAASASPEGASSSAPTPPARPAAPARRPTRPGRP